MPARAEDAAHWLVGCAVPELLGVDDGQSTALIPAAAELLRDYAFDAWQRTVSRRQQANVVSKAHRARMNLQESAGQAGRALESMGRPVEFLRRYGSVAGMLDARFPSFVEAAQRAREDARWVGLDVVDEAYRAGCAIICRSLLIAQASGAEPRQLERAYGRAVQQLRSYALSALVPVADTHGVAA
ncbi:hypothetical protein A9Z40_01825 [Microbacterium arborescens]|uniref:Uncharacterized protein n=1 Tax=Microbacterium arborescens TaxID=33883 RepID=A0ABX2WJJ0_9MICO|nr:hypothetical protein [Microbacterium arborescens]OAZ41440.1 hypothetical protein A9Z40_01825 [Microbacterium arborescens]